MSGHIYLVNWACPYLESNNCLWEDLISMSLKISRITTGNQLIILCHHIKKMTKLSSDEQRLFGIPMLGHIHGHKVRVAPPSSSVPAWGAAFVWSFEPDFFIPSRIPAQSIALQCCVLQNSAGSTLQKRRCEDHPTSLHCPVYIEQMIMLTWCFYFLSRQDHKLLVLISIIWRMSHNVQ